MDFELERFMHLYAMNRGILLTPFHNMALMCPQTEADDVDKHTKVFREALNELAGMTGVPGSADVSRAFARRGRECPVSRRFCKTCRRYPRSLLVLCSRPHETLPIFCCWYRLPGCSLVAPRLLPRSPRRSTFPNRPSTSGRRGKVIE